MAESKEAWIPVDDYDSSEPNQGSKLWHYALCFCNDGFTRALERMVKTSNPANVWDDCDICYVVTHCMKIPEPPND